VKDRNPCLILLTLLLCGVPWAALGCNSKSAQSSHVTTAVPGRHIDAHADGPVSVRNTGDQAVVSILSHELIIKRDRILLDGAELATLPVDATHIGVKAAKGELTVTADGVTVARKQLAN
jgi:hypothetical protein